MFQLFMVNMVNFLGTTVEMLISTHYHCSNLIWQTVSHRVGELISSDHSRCKESSVIP